MKLLYLIIADDLTGALDTTVAFADRGLRCEVALSTEFVESIIDAEVIGCNAQTRTLSAEQAAKNTTSITQKFVELGFTNLYKKIDSTLRGNIGSETIATLDSRLFDIAIICPTFPDMNRTVENGVLNIGGLSHIDSSSEIIHLPSLLEEQTNEHIGHLLLSEVTEGAETIEHRISNLFSENIRIIACDAATDSNLNTLIEAAERSSYRILLVGSGGLASVMASRTVRNTFATRSGGFDCIAGPVLTVCGSLNELSQRQIHQLGANTTTVELSAQSDTTIDQQIIETCTSEIANGCDVVLTWDDPIGIALVIESAQSALEFVSRIATVASAIVRDVKPAGLVLVGGETAYLTLKMLQATSIEVLGEALNGIPVGVVKGGVADSVTLTTKAGGFGDENAVLKLLEILHGHEPESDDGLEA